MEPSEQNTAATPAIAARMEAGISTHYIGRNADNHKVIVEIAVRHDLRSIRHLTDHNRDVLGEILSITGNTVSVASARRQDIESGGQIIDELDTITEPANGWTLDDIAGLRNIWKVYHLNDLCAESDEQAAPARALDYSYDKLRGLTDSQGYVYGSAWLNRYIPDIIVTEIDRLRHLPTNSREIPNFLTS